MRLRNAMLQSIAQQNICTLLSFAAGVVVARLLSPHEVGLYAVSLAAMNVASAIKDFGISSYVISHPKPDDTLLKAAFGLTLAIAILLALGFIALSWPLARFYGDPSLGPVLRIVALGQLAAQVTFPATVLITRDMRFDILFFVGLASVTFQGLVSVWLGLTGFGSSALAWGYVAGGVAGAGVALLARPRSIRIAPSLVGSRRLLRFGGWMSSTLFVSAAAMSMPEMLIGRVLGLGEAALFSRAQNIVSIIRNGLFFAMMRPMLPKLGALEGQKLSLAPIYLRVIESVTGFAWPAYALLAIWAEPLVRAIYGPAWSGAAALIPPLALAHSLTLAIAPHYDILIVKRRAALLFACEFGLFVAALLALAWAVPHGLRPGAWALAAIGALFAFTFFAVLKSIVGFSAEQLAGVWVRSLLLTVAVAPPAMLVRNLAPDSAIGAIVGCAASGLLAAAIWVAAIRLLGHEIEGHIAPILARFMPGLKAAPAKNGAGP